MEEKCSFRFILVFRCQCGWWMETTHFFVFQTEADVKAPGALPSSASKARKAADQRSLFLYHVLVLGRPQLGTKQRRSYSTGLVDVDSFFQESPGSVNDLGPCLHCDLLFGAGNGVGHEANESIGLFQRHSHRPPLAFCNVHHCPAKRLRPCT